MALIITIPNEIAKALISHAAKGDARFALNGILLEAEKDRIILVSSDTHRLICYSPATQDDAAPVLADFVAKGKAEQKAIREKEIREYNHESDDKLAPRIALAMQAIDENPLRIILSIPSFKSRLLKAPVRNHSVLTLDTIRPDECVLGEFPQYRDFIGWPSDKAGIEFNEKGDMESIFLPQGSGVNMKYLQQAVPVLDYMATRTMQQDTPESPFIASTGLRPWVVTGEQGDFLAVLIMPIRKN